MIVTGTFDPSSVDWSSIPAGIYELLQYGRIPRLDNAPTPAAPQTIDQMTKPGSWTTEDAIAGSNDAWRAAYAADVQAAEDAGKYVSTGRLPVDASGNLNFSASALPVWLALGGLAIAAFIVWKVLR